MNLARAGAVLPAPSTGVAVRQRPRRMGGVLLAAGVVTAVVTAVAPGGTPPGALVVAAVLVLAWAVAGAALQGMPAPVVATAGRAVAAGVTIGACGTVAGALAARPLTGGAAAVAEVVRGAAAGALPSVGLAVLAADPVSRPASLPRRAVIAAALLASAATAAGYALVRPALPLWPLAAETSVALAIGLPLLADVRRRAARIGRRRLQLFLLSCVLAMTAAALLVTARVVTGSPRGIVEGLALCSLPLPLALSVVGFHHRLRSVDAVNAVVAQVVAAAAVVVAAAALVVLTLGHQPSGGESDVLALSMVATAAAALVFGGVRERLGSLLSGGLLGAGQAPDAILRDFTGHLSRSVPLDELVAEMAEALSRVLELARVEVWTWTGAALDRTVSVPALDPARVVPSPEALAVAARSGVSGAAWAAMWFPEVVPGHDGDLRVAPVAHAGQLLGLIVVSRRDGTGVLSDEDCDLLGGVARQLGLALHNLRLDTALQSSLQELERQAAELRASRARVVAAADHERRRIERDLHDGAQQRLVALAVQVGLARRIVDVDPAQAAVLLDQLAAETREAVQEVRRLAHGIYPPLLMDRGLGEALRAAATHSPVEVTVDADPGERPPQVVEAAVYFCCLEALQNAAKHAGEGVRVVVRIRRDRAALHFAVEDDGRGFDADSVVRGAGFVNMGDRLGAVGGTLRVTSSPGSGTVVAGTVPLSG